MDYPALQNGRGLIHLDPPRTTDDADDPLDEEDGDRPSPRLFYLGRDDKPEELAANVTRLFLGVRLECAQCHDHPFGKWKREQFWSQAAFFAGFKPPKDAEFIQSMSEAPDRREMSIPGVTSDRVAQARFLDGNNDGTPGGSYVITGTTTNKFFRFFGDSDGSGTASFPQSAQRAQRPHARAFASLAAGQPAAGVSGAAHGGAGCIGAPLVFRDGRRECRGAGNPSRGGRQCKSASPLRGRKSRERIVPIRA